MKSNKLEELPLITICSNNQVLKEQGGKILPLSNIDSSYVALLITDLHKSLLIL